MKILISGSTGLIGSALVSYLSQNGHDVVRLLRTDDSESNTYWHPEKGEINLPKNINIDTVIHLAGANIVEKRWTRQRKALIRDSRLEGTRLLVKALTELDPMPKTLLSASAIGIYGHRGNDILNENSKAGKGFLSDICIQWEMETLPAKNAGIRVVNLRTGLVLSRSGGILEKMLLPFRFGLGATIGSGTQYMSWIAIDDYVRAINHILADDSLAGPVNLAAPDPANNHSFTKTLAEVLHRPAFFRIPSFFIKAFFGEMGDKLLLLSARAHPSSLIDSGFRFQYPKLHDALSHLLKN